MRKRSRILAVLLAAVGFVGVGVATWYFWPKPPPPEPVVAHPLPPYSQTPFLNTGPDATYVGIDACKECHKANHQSYLATAHSRALTDLDPAAEPPDGAFEHKASGRSYRVYRQ